MGHNFSGIPCIFLASIFLEKVLPNYRRQATNEVLTFSYRADPKELSLSATAYQLIISVKTQKKLEDLTLIVRYIDQNFSLLARIDLFLLESVFDRNCSTAD